MNEKRIVSVETAAALKAVYTGLADFIHKHKLEQIVGAGPSAYPHTIAIARAYKNRHGKELKVYNLGELGETLVFKRFEAKKEAIAFLKRYRPTLDISRHTLIFDETTSTGLTLRGLKNIFKVFGVRCKTSTLHQTGVLGHKVADFSGEANMALFGEGVRVHRGYALVWRRKRGNMLEWLSYMRQLHAELREIADSVPKAELKRK